MPDINKCNFVEQTKTLVIDLLPEQKLINILKEVVFNWYFSKHYQSVPLNFPSQKVF